MTDEAKDGLEGLDEGGSQDLKDQNLDEDGSRGNQDTKTVPIQRFNQVYGQMKEMQKAIESFKEFGDPTALREKLAKLAKYDQAIADHRKQEAMTDKERAQVQRAAQLRKELVELFPELGQLGSLKEMAEALKSQQAEISETRAEANIKEMQSKFKQELIAAKIDPKWQTKIEEYIVSQMSEEEQQRFIRGEYNIAVEIFNRELKEGLLSAFQRSSVPKPFVRNTPGGTPPDGKKKDKPMSMKEADEIAAERFINGGE